MEDIGDSKPELHGWKQIADHLGITVRAAQNWEKAKGLPIRRMSGARGRVFAAIADLERWRQSQTQSQVSEDAGSADSISDSDSSITPKASRAGRIWTSGLVTRAVMGAAAVLALTATIVYFVFYRPGPPARGRIENNTLIVSDARGRELWRKEFQEKLREFLEPEGNYRAWAGDLERDGQVEILFALVYQKSPTVVSGELICYSSKGRENWRFKPGKAVSTATENFPDDYWPINFVVAPMGRNLPNSIVVCSMQNAFYPTQVALLSKEGHLQRDYWHSGVIGHYDAGGIVVTDMDHDDVNEIYLGGVNNSYDRATLIVLDPNTMAGASIEENPKYQIQGLGPACERARILFPESCITRATVRYAGVRQLDIHNNRVTVCIPPFPDAPTMRYELSPDLKVLGLDVGDHFISTHRNYRSSGKLDHDWSPKEEAELRNIRLLRPPPPSSTLAVTHRLIR